MVSTVRFASRLLPIAAVAVMLVPSSARAQAADRWEFTLTPYAWLPWLDNEVRIRGNTLTGTDATQTISVLDSLDMALMGTFDARYGRVGVVMDAIWVRLSGDAAVTTTLGPTLGFDLQVDMTVVQGGLTYRFVDEPKGFLEGVVGTRLLITDVESTFGTSGGISIGGGVSQVLVDPLIGVRGSWRFAERWSLSGYADLGGFDVGTEMSWQAVATLDYAFNQHVILRLGYRALAADFQQGPLELDVLLHGPMIGLTFAF